MRLILYHYRLIFMSNGYAQISRTVTPSLDPKPIVAGIHHGRPGQVIWRPQGRPEWALFFTSSGRGVFTGGQTPIPALKGDLVALAPGTPHDYGGSPLAKSWINTWVHFHPRAHWKPWMNWPTPCPGIHKLSLPPGHLPIIRRWLQEIVNIPQSHTPFKTDIAMNRLESILLACMTLTGDPNAGLVEDIRINRAMTWLDHHFYDNPTLEELARRSGLSRARFATLFKARTGCTPMEYRDHRRLDQAYYLLRHTSIPIAQIAQELGYTTSYYFAYRFKKATGLTPGHFRRQSLLENSSQVPTLPYGR
jgi:AraC family transcriptional regulator of arabinose operon